MKPRFKTAPHSFFQVDLSRLILWMCVFFTLLALGNSLYAGYTVQRNLLLQHNLQVNGVYAGKLAQVANAFLGSSALILESAALDLTTHGISAEAAQNELEQLASLTNSFNVLIVVGATGETIASISRHAAAQGAQHPPSLAWLPQTDIKSSAIIGPIKGPTGRWITLIAHPLFLPDGSYAGFIGGVLHLHSDSSLQAVLNAHRSPDIPYFYIVNNAGTVVYDPTKSLIGSSLKDTAAVQAVLRGEAGSLHITGGDPDDLLVSYAPISFATWGIVIQEPEDTAFTSINDLFLSTFLKSLPLFIASLLAIWWMARFIARPLRELADVAANLDDRDNFSRIRFINSWYLEAALLRRGLLQGFSAVGTRIRKLHREGSTDPLTGLLNRRGLETAIHKLTQSGRTVAVLMIDIDHFKVVNDTYGHDAGDRLLTAIAAAISAEARSEDVVARSGGEEFIILLPETELNAATRIAERIRSVIEETSFNEVDHTSISIGIARYPEHGNSIHDCLLAADTALYRAKSAGRNRVQAA